MAVAYLFLFMGIIGSAWVASSSTDTPPPATNTTTLPPTPLPPSPSYQAVFVKTNNGFYACHNRPNATSSPSKAAEELQTIDKALKDLYDSITNKNVSYEEDCTYSLPFQRGPGDPLADTELALLFERFEQLRSNYERGLWGYCNATGVANLTVQINNLKDAVVKANGNNDTVKICDRYKLLGCHEKFNKCKCLTDDRNFRNIASEYWNDSNPDLAKEDKIGESKCVLSTGSDCNFIPHGYFQCHPDSKCLYKHDKKPCLLRSGYHRPALPPSTNYVFTNHNYSNIYCQCYSYFAKAGIIVAPKMWIVSILAIFASKHRF